MAVGAEPISRQNQTSVKPVEIVIWTRNPHSSI